MKAERTYWTPRAPWAEYAKSTWNSGTNTFSWDGTFGVRAIQTGFQGDLSGYKSFHATVSSLTGDGVDKLQLKVNCTGGTEKMIDLLSGENSIDMTDWFADPSAVTTFELWGPKSTDTECSAVVTDVYLDATDAPFVTTAGSLGEEITDIKYIIDGGKFVAVSNDGKRVQTYVSGSAGASATNVESVTNDMYYYLQLAAAPDTLDVNQDGVIDEATYYSIGIYNASGEAKPSNWWGANYICRIGWGDLWSTNFAVNMDGGKITTNHFGRDNAYSAVWTVAYEEGNGFKFYNPQSNNYMTVNGTQNNVYYLKLYKSIDFTSRTMYPANDEIFALSKATGYNATTGEMTNGTWTFDTPVDISNWKYFIIAMENGCADGSHEIAITDNNGKTVKGEDYVGTDAGTGPNMWFSRWNHQNIGCFNLDYLKNTLGLDIENIKSLSIAGTTKPFAVYLSCYDNSKLLTTNRWVCYKEGDLVRTYAQADAGKFGTVCLPYKASVAGAEVYSIASANESTITLTKVNGLLEAGKPYFYKASDSVGKDNEGTICNVNFFRADFDKYDASIPITSNGLIGTFTAIEAVPQGDDIFVLSSNKLYQVNSAVSLAANRAYVDKSQITNTQATSRTISLAFDDATAIDNMQVVNEIANQAIYNLSGQRVAQPTKGLYIVNGKKVIIK